MDQLKNIGAQLKKHHFWVLGGVALVVGLVGWYSARSALSKVYEDRRRVIDSEFQELQQIASTPDHPNQKFISEIDGSIKQLQQNVGQAWQLVYNEQREKVLKWPAPLSARFHSVVPNLPIDKDIPIDLREQYQNYVEKEFPRLLEIIEAKSYLDLTPPGSDPEAEAKFKVTWNKDNQKSVAETLVWAQPPTTLDVRQTQENLWVYRALLTIVQHLNDRATGSYNAKVKEIATLSIGKDAAPAFVSGRSSGRIYRPEAPAAAPAAEAASAPPQQEDPNSGRYVDAQGNPLAPGVTPAEFKRMPVFLRLVIDQREIGRLLVECANSPLPVEVRQFRLKPLSHLAAKESRRATLLGEGDNLAGPSVVDVSKQGNPNDVVLELHGIISIFNPPDPTKLGNAVAAVNQPAVPPAGADLPAAVPATPEAETRPAEANENGGNQQNGAQPVQPAEAGATPPAAAGAEQPAGGAQPPAAPPAGPAQPAAGTPPAPGEE